MFEMFRFFNKRKTTICWYCGPIIVIFNIGTPSGTPLQRLLRTLRRRPLLETSWYTCAAARGGGAPSLRNVLLDCALWLCAKGILRKALRKASYLGSGSVGTQVLVYIHANIPYKITNFTNVT